MPHARDYYQSLSGFIELDRAEEKHLLPPLLFRINTKWSIKKVPKQPLEDPVFLPF